MTTRNNKEESFAEDVSASLSRCLEGIDIQKKKKKPSNGKAAARAQSAASAPTADGMQEALESSLDAVLGKADGGFLAGLLDGGDSDDPANRDYGERYQYIDVLGEGGQGKVLRFRDNVLDRDVAIKVVKPPHTKEREQLLENEARLGGMLEHPNILPTYDLCRDETGSPFFVMKKVEGISLDKLLKKAHADGAIYFGPDQGEFSRRRLLNIFLQVCHAMQYAHSRGVCHLDLKPQNVTLGPFGEVYVLDWGFAARASDNPKLVAGTPLYIAPERFKPGRPDARCDVYSLGVMLYRILLNQLPRNVGKTSFREFRRRFSDFPIVPPRQRDPSIPRDLEAIILKAMNENPDERYQTVGELAGDLERFLDILPVSAYREGLYGRTIKFIRRHRTGVVAAAFMLVALMFTATAVVRARHLEAQTREAEQTAKLQELEGKKARLEALMAQEARVRIIADEKRRDEERKALLRRRASARVPLEKGLVVMDRSKAAVDRERDKAKKVQLLQPAIDYFSQALAILEDGDVESQDAAEAYYARARAYEAAQEIDKAEADYRMAYERDPSYIMAHYYLGLIYFNNRNYDVKRAMAEFVAMNEIDPGNEFSEIGQAYIEAHIGKDGDALARVDRIEAKERAARGKDGAEESWRNPGLYNIWLIRGRVYGNRSGKFFDPAKAIEAYTNYCVYDPDKPAPYINRGTLRLDLRDQALQRGDRAEAMRQLDAAIADYTLAIEADPKSKLALEHRAFALFKYKEDLEGGLRDIEEAIRIDPKYDSAILTRAAIRETQGKYDLAEKDYELVKKNNPDHRNIDYRLAILYMYMGKLDKAEAAFDLAVEKTPDKHSRGIRYNRRGIVRFLRGDYKGAVKDFDKSIELRSRDRVYPALMRWLALTKLGTPPSAEEFGKQIDAGKDKPWLAVVASIYLGDDPFLEEQAFRLADSAEATCEVGFYLGARAWARGETVNALAFLQRAVDSDVRLFMEYIMAKNLADRLLRQQREAEVLPDRLGGAPQSGQGTPPADAAAQPTLTPMEEEPPAASSPPARNSIRNTMRPPEKIILPAIRGAKPNEVEMLRPDVQPQVAEEPALIVPTPSVDEFDGDSEQPDALPVAPLPEQEGLPPIIPSMSDLFEPVHQ